MQIATKQMIKAALFEASFVVMGVILALAANDWHNNRQIQKETERALHSIHLELTENQQLVSQSRDYHQSTLQKLSSLSSAPHIGQFDKGFIFPARISENAWRTASETGALKHAPFEDVLALSKLYAAQSRYENQSQTVGNIIYQKLFEGGAQAMLENYQNLNMIIATMSYRENELLQLYEATLPALITKQNK